MRIVVLDADTLGRDLDLSPFRTFGELVVHGYTPPSLVAEHLREADVAVCNKTRMDAARLEGASHLRLVCVTGTGTDAIDKAFCLRKGIGVCNIRGYSTDSVVQHTFALLLELMERTSRFDAYTRSGDYVGDTAFRYLDWTFHELAGRRFGILGMGTIGRKVAHVAQAFGCETVYWSSTGADRDAGSERLELDALLATSDVVSIHAPLDDRTRGLLSDRELSLMKSSAILLNLGRGGIVDEPALARALRAGRLAGCGLDVLADEPMTDRSPLREVLSCGRLLVTPHVAWASIEARTRCIDEIVLNIRDFLAGGHRNRVEGDARGSADDPSIA
jgi:lactate dehydrogenase-like 2-hydroxyacid dehydrogenase